MNEKENLNSKEVEQLYGKPIENDGSEPVTYTKPSIQPQDLKLYELYEQDTDNTNTRSGKMSRLRKTVTSQDNRVIDLQKSIEDIFDLTVNPKYEAEYLEILERFNTELETFVYGDSTVKAEKSYGLKKNAAEMLTEREAATSFITNLDECLQELTSVSDSFQDAMMFLDSLKNEHYLQTPESIRDYLSNAWNSFEDMYKQLENFQKQLETEEIKFTNNH